MQLWVKFSLIKKSTVEKPQDDRGGIIHLSVKSTFLLSLELILGSSSKLLPISSGIPGGTARVLSSFWVVHTEDTRHLDSQEIIV
jgi:hypothetical protein